MLAAVVARAAEHRALLRAVPADADLIDAVPAEKVGVDDDTLAQFETLTGPGDAARQGPEGAASHAASLSPILDSRLRNLYEQGARTAAWLGSPICGS